MPNSFEKMMVFLEQTSLINQNDKEILSQKIECKNFKKNSIITREGLIENYIYFISEGYTRLFMKTEHKDTTFVISGENELTCSFGSFANRKPSAFFLQAVSDVKTIAISWSNLNILYQNFSNINNLYRKLLEYHFTLKENRELDLLTKTPKEMYETLAAQKPEIIQNVPQKFIASYLGITPQALSRIKKQI